MTRWRCSAISRGPFGLGAYRVSVVVTARLWFDARSLGARLLGALAADVVCEVAPC